MRWVRPTGMQARLLLLALLVLGPALAVALAGVPPAAGVLATVGALVAGNWLVVRPVREVVAALQRRQREVDRSTSQRQRLVAELIAAEEEERKRIAADLHDDSIQALGALLLRLELVESRLEDPESRRALAEARASTREAIDRLRHMVFKLSPPALESSGLATALDAYVTEVARASGAETRVDDRLAADPSGEVRALVYRIAVEAVNNAARHARASHLAVSLDGRDGGVFVRVRDDGAGFDVTEVDHPAPGHIGLMTMRERAEVAGGWWRAQSRLGEGTTIEFWVPDRGSAA